MPRQRKDGEYLNCKIQSSIAKELENYCKTTGLTKTVTVEKALDSYLSGSSARKIKQI